MPDRANRAADGVLSDRLTPLNRDDLASA